ncbi:ribosome biogenesis GTP-binding protein YihA/YsxC [Spirosoma pomorum]
MDQAGYVPFCVIFTNFAAILVVNVMPVKQSEFLVSNSDPAKCPKPDRPEYAFIGRSNVGKSSLINMLTGRTSLAKISGKPGKTQLINHFIIDNDWYLVDLPGYGYAQVSKTDREKFAALIDGYLTGRPNLLCIFVLVDSRIEPQKIDLDFMENLGDRGLPFVVVFTKTEKLGPTKLQTTVENYRNKLLETWEDIPQMFVTSAVTAVGREEILSFIRPLNEEFWQNEKTKKRY